VEFKGLTDEEVKKSRRDYGNNSIEGSKGNTFFNLLLESLGDPIIKILLVALLVKVIFLFQDFNWFETLGILIAIFLASFISTISEYGSEKAFKRLQEESSKIFVRVLRNESITKVSVEDVVVKDIVMLGSGEVVPADGFLIKGNILIDESRLNGESKEVQKSNGEVVLRGAIITDGECVIQISNVGEKTVYGKIAKELNEKTIESPLRMRLRKLAQVISRIGYIGSVCVVISYLFSVIVIDNNYDWSLILETLKNGPVMIEHLIYSLTLCVTVIIMAVPEGLPMMVALVLSSNMKRMLKSNVLVRKMVGIETAGSLNILFTDKTGTLTEGSLNVIGFLDNSGNLYNKESLEKVPKYKEYLYDSILYNNTSTMSIDGEILGGNSTDKALMKYIKREKICETEILISFNSKNKYSAVKNIDKNIVYFKGASEVILNSCDYYYDSNLKKSIIRDKKKILEEIKNYTKQGFRVISLAVNEKNSDMKGLIFLGCVLLKDTVRKEALEGLNLVESADIDVVMITGDDKDTAYAIASELKIVKNKNDLVITSGELASMNDDEIKKILPNIRVVARALPQDKSRLVKISQEMGLVVGMTGDGVNDAPALKCADVGFSMGSGTEVAKEASDVVILDDNFLSISKAILYGRTIFKSLRKFIVYQLTVNTCAIILSIISPVLGVATPITIIQMLWINMIMDTLSGLAFSYEYASNEYMMEPSKKRDEPIINRCMYGSILWCGVYAAFLSVLFLRSDFISKLITYDVTNKYFLTAFFALFIFMGIFNAFNARVDSLNLFKNLKKNKIFIIIFLCISVVQIYLIYFGGSIFRTYGLSFKELLFVIILAFSVIPIDIIRKYILKLKKINKYY